jgi:hypothetical protein
MRGSPGGPVVGTRAWLSDGSLAAPTNVSEQTNTIFMGLGVWTGTMINGGNYTNHGADWTSPVAPDGGSPSSSEDRGPRFSLADPFDNVIARSEASQSPRGAS